MEELTYEEKSQIMIALVQRMELLKEVIESFEKSGLNPSLLDTFKEELILIESAYDKLSKSALKWDIS